MAYKKKTGKRPPKSAASTAAAQQPNLPSAAEEYADIDHEKLVRWTNEAEDTGLESREVSEKCRDYYDTHGQITPEERKALIKRNQAPVIINRIKPKMDALMGMEKSAKTTAKAFPRTPRHEKDAEAATEAIRFVLQDNQFDQIRSHVWDNLIIEGSGGCDVTVEPPDEDGKNYKIVIRPIMWDRMLWDPHSRRKDYSDARFLGQVVWMDYDEAMAKYPDAEDVLEEMIGDAGSVFADKPRWMDNTRRRVKIVEMYYRKADGEIWYACFTRGGYCEAPKKSPFVDEEGNTEWCYEFASAFVDREGGRYGACKQLLDVQDEINKRRSKALHLMSVRQVRLERGAVEDVNKARQELAKPDGVLETTPGMEFEVLKTGDMAAAQFNLLTEAKLEIDQVGANAAIQGKDKGVESGIALQRRQQAGQTEVGPMFDVLRYWQQRVFRKVWNRIRQYWKAEQWVRVTDDMANMRWVGVNRQMTKGDMMMEQAQASGLPPEQMQALMAQMQQQPEMQEMTVQNRLADLDVDIIIQEVPDVLTAQIEDFQVLGEMIKSGFPMPPKAVIMASPLSNKDQILKMMDEKPQIPPELQEQMKQMQEQAQKLAEENQALKADQQTEMAKLQVNQAEAKAKLELRQQELEAELMLQKQKQDGELALAREKAEAEIALKRAIAEAEIALKRAIAEADLQIEAAKLAQQKEVEGQRMANEREAAGARFALEKEESDREASMKAEQMNMAKEKDVSPKILATLENVVTSINAPKKPRSMTITLPDGRKATAQVS